MNSKTTVCNKDTLILQLLYVGQRYSMSEASDLRKRAIANLKKGLSNLEKFLISERDAASTNARHLQSITMGQMWHKDNRVIVDFFGGQNPGGFSYHPSY